jgi:hypothetical protein
MKHFQVCHCIVYVLGVLLFIVVLFIPGLQSVSAGDHPQLIKSGDFVGWHYTAVRQPDGQLMATVDYNQLSTAGLEHYAIANKDLTRQLPKTGLLAVSVTFRYPMAIDAFQNWVSSNGMIVQAYTLRATTVAGEKWTIGGKPYGGRLVPMDSLNRQLASIRAYGEAKLDGVVGVDGTINTANVVSLQAEREVFLVDLTTAFVRQELRPLLGKDSDQVQVVRPPVYWFMEKYGLRNTSF